MSNRTAPVDHALLEALLHTPLHDTDHAPWLRAPMMRPVARPARRQVHAPLLGTRPVVVAGTLLLVAGIVAGSLGVTPARAARVVVSAPLATYTVAESDTVSVASDVLRPAERAAADDALLESLLASEPGTDAVTMADASAAARRAADTALLSSLLASEPSAVASAPAASVSFATVASLPAASQVYRPAPLALPALTVAQQPPPPPGYQQPPGYQDGVPFGGQIGAVPGSTGSRPPSTPAPRPPSTPAPRPPSTPTTYVVQAGDTLSGIAVRFYGDASMAPLIWETNFKIIGNDPNRLIPGQRLTLPAVPGRPIPPASGVGLPQGTIARPGNYTIQPRDFLRWMAQRAYGNEMRWREIYNANRTVLGPNPDLIHPDVRVFVP